MTSRKPMTPAEKAARLKSMQQRAVDNIESEIRRICEVPLSRQLTDEEMDAVNAHYVKPEEYAKPGGFRLMPRQAQALVEFNETGGLFGPIAAGGGKTYITQLIADDVYREILQQQREGGEKRVPRVLLIVPSQVLSQLQERDVAKARKNTRFSCPVHFLGGVSKDRRLLIAKSQRRGLYVLTYSLLSAEGADELLDAINPPVVILDEAHNVASRYSARAMRFRRFVDRTGPQVVVLSGTLTKKGLMDYHYLSKVTLGQNNFLPNAVTLAEAWSMIVDSTASSLSEFYQTGVPQSGPILPLVDWVHSRFPELANDEKKPVTKDLVGFRRALAIRSRCTPGVVASGDDDVGSSLLIENHPVPKAAMEQSEGYEKMQEIVKTLTTEWKTPDGDEIDHAMHLWKWRYEIEGAGFYNSLYWPDVEWVQAKRRLSARDAEDLLERSKHHHLLLNEYHKELRRWIKDNARKGLDTPKQIGLDMRNHGADNVGQSLYATWKAAKDAEFDGMLKRLNKSVRVCDFKVAECLRYVQDFKKNNPGEGIIIWYDNQEVGAWMHETLRAAGIDSVHCMAGPKYNSLIASETLHGKVIVATFNAHGTGKNLHAFGTAYFLQWPRPATDVEQTIAREHRTGQERDEVLVVTNLSNEFDRVSFSATMNDAAYVSQSTGNRQRLMYATYNPVPTQVPFTVMVEWGANPLSISEEAMRLLDEASGGGGKI